MAAVPAAIALSELSDAVRLLDAAAAIPVAAAFAVAALWLARGARRRTERTIGRIGGIRVARAGRLLGVVGLCVAWASAVAVVSYYALSHFAD